MKRYFAGAALCACLAASSAAVAAPSQDYLTPQLKAGDQLKTIFSKAVSIKGPGFDEYVKRISGTATDTVIAVAPDVLKMSETYRYDGAATGEGTVEVRDHGSTNCAQGKCSANDQTSGSMFIPYLWGAAPADIKLGSSWTATIAAPWEIGAAGTEQVRVVRLIPDSHIITLRREGAGGGPSSDDAAQTKPITIVSNGKSIKVKLTPHETHWEGLATFSRGVTISDEIIATRPVTLIAEDGTKFEAEERVYTLLMAAA